MAMTFRARRVLYASLGIIVGTVALALATAWPLGPVVNPAPFESEVVR